MFCFDVCAPSAAPEPEAFAIEAYELPTRALPQVAVKEEETAAQPAEPVYFVRPDEHFVSPLQ